MTSQNNDQAAGSDVTVDYRSFLTWIATSIMVYLLVSGLTIVLGPFGSYVQYSILVHSGTGLVATVPLCIAVYLHWRRRRADATPQTRRAALTTIGILGVSILSGLLLAALALFSIRVPDIASTLHLGSGILLGLLLLYHLAPIVRRYRTSQATVRRAPRKRFVATGAAIIFVFFGITGLLSLAETPASHFRAFSDNYDWPHGDDRAFWPSRAAIAEPPWHTQFLAAVSAQLGGEISARLASALTGPETDGFRNRVARFSAELGLDDRQAGLLGELVDKAVAAQRASGALDPQSLRGSATCGSSGCHEAIYAEWRPSAHGFAAEDPLFLRVQSLLIASRGAAESRACAGCHDPAALLGGTRYAAHDAGTEVAIFEGNSCVSCHSTIDTDTHGNGGYVIRPPRRYLFERYDGDEASLFTKFLIRTYPAAHVADYKRPLYKTSEFCAACHKQLPTAGEATTAGLAQEQNEYDSWKQGRWYHGDDDPRTVACRECHMPLVDGVEPASGDDTDPYRDPGDGRHRSHRMLASNMYVPQELELPGHAEQVAQTIAWLRGEIDIPEIADKWVSGPAVTLDILAPDTIRAGDLVNIKLYLHNNKSGHDFPAGPLDVLESWVELTVEDSQGNLLMELGADRNIDPSIDAPVVYKADWYDRQGLPVERHNLWDVVGASYKRVIRSGGSDVVDVPFRCPGTARPSLSDSASESGPGERQSDVVFSIENEEFDALHVTARLLFRKANPEFLARVYEFEPVADAPAVEIVKATHTIRVVPD